MHGGGMKSAESYDAKEAYNKDLSSKARMHYLENDIADKKGMSRYSVEKGPHAKHGNAPHRDASPLNNITYGDKSGPTGYIGEQKADLMKYNPVDDRAGMSRYGADQGDSPAKGLGDTLKKIGRTVTRGIGDIGMQAVDMIRPDAGSHASGRRSPGATSYQDKLNQKSEETAHYQKSRDLAASGKTYGSLSSIFDDDGHGNTPAQTPSKKKINYIGG